MACSATARMCASRSMRWCVPRWHAVALDVPTRWRSMARARQRLANALFAIESCACQRLQQPSGHRWSRKDAQSRPWTCRRSCSRTRDASTALFTGLWASEPAAGLAAARRRKNLRGVHRVKAVLLAAKITAHFDLARSARMLLGFGRTQAADHVAHAFALQVQAKRGVCGSKRMTTFLPRTGGAGWCPTSSVSSSSHGSAGRQDGDAVVVLIQADVVARGAGHVGLALRGQALDQQPCGDLVVCGQDQPVSSCSDCSM
jgi:hypothetical protein